MLVIFPEKSYFVAVFSLKLSFGNFYFFCDIYGSLLKYINSFKSSCFTSLGKRRENSAQSYFIYMNLSHLFNTDFPDPLVFLLTM